MNEETRRWFSVSWAWKWASLGTAARLRCLVGRAGVLYCRAQGTGQDTARGKTWPRVILGQVRQGQGKELATCKTPTRARLWQVPDMAKSKISVKGDTVMGKTRQRAARDGVGKSQFKASEERPLGKTRPEGRKRPKARQGLKRKTRTWARHGHGQETTMGKKVPWQCRQEGA